MILIGYDGCDDARGAIKQAAALFPDQAAVVLTVWEPFTELLTHSPASIAPLAGVDVAEFDQASRKSAEGTAEDGAGFAGEAGLDASARTRARTSTAAQAILKEAGDVSADVVVLGSRGLGGIGSLLLGSVSHAVLQHADRPVMVIPAPEAARSRRQKAQTHEKTSV